MVGGFGISTRGALPPPVQLSTVIGAAESFGASHILAPSIFELSPHLDAHELLDVRAQVHDAGLTMAVGLHFLHPYRLHASSDLLTAGDGDALRGLVRALESAALFDDPDLQFVVGDPEDRSHAVVPWAEQIVALAGLLKHLRPTLLDLGVRLCVKTHEEITSFEVLHLIEAVGKDVISVGFDPVNSLIQLEDPHIAATRLAPSIAHVYFDDATFVRNADIFSRRLCDIGDGALDWPSLHETVTTAAPDARWWIDLHKGQFAVRPFDREVLAGHPDLSVTEFAAFLRLAMLESVRHSRQTETGLTAAQPEPWLRLASTCGALSALVTR